MTECTHTASQRLAVRCAERHIDSIPFLDHGAKLRRDHRRHAGPENAAGELVEDGVNGFVTESAEPGELAEAVLRVVRAGERLRASTLEWYERHRGELSMEASLSAVEASYSEGFEASVQARS